VTWVEGVDPSSFLPRGHEARSQEGKISYVLRKTLGMRNDDILIDMKAFGVAEDDTVVVTAASTFDFDV